MVKAVVAVETVVWFPRSCGRVFCVHSSGSFHGPRRPRGRRAMRDRELGCLAGSASGSLRT
jgi:hypothetical protein